MFLSFSCIAHGSSNFSSQIKTIRDKAGNQFEQLKKSLSLNEKPQKQKLNMQTRTDLVSFLTKDPNYKGKINLQKRFLDRLQITTDISDAQRKTILNMIKQKELEDQEKVKQGISGEGKTVEQETSELSAEKRLSPPPLPPRDTPNFPPAVPSRPTTFTPVPVLPIAPPQK